MSLGLQQHFDKQNNDINTLESRRKILESLKGMNIHPDFCEPLANMLGEINATTAQIMKVQGHIQEENQEITDFSGKQRARVRGSILSAANDDNFSQAA